ncbi:MAG: M20 family metallopeptidase [Desulfurococcales archaeon]|nr:M20 family metallopeptidase [Desulfurococcales archaeon]
MGLLDRIDSLQEDIVNILSEMVRVPTVSPSGENYGEFVDNMKSLLESYELTYRFINVPQSYVDEHCPEEAKGNPRYIIEVKLEGGEEKPVDFNGHYDVVPGGPGWTVTEPFKPLLKDGKLYGRGSVDMKGGLASVLAAFIALKEEGVKPKRTARLYMVPDEEIGGECGTGWLVDHLDVTPEAVVIPEPSGTGKIWHGHKGALWVEVIVKGKTAHASTPWLGVNAFEGASKMAVWLFENYVPSVGLISSRYKFDLEGAERATAMIGGVVGMKSEGKINQVPGSVYFTIDRRINPEENVESALKQMKEFLELAAEKAQAEYELKIVHTMEPALTPVDTVAVKMVTEAASKIGLKVEPTVCMGGLDLRYYTVKGIPASSYGPGNNTPHMPNEYVDLDELVKAAKVFALLLQG